MATIINTAPAAVLTRTSVDGNINIPVATSAVIPEGALVAINSSGQAILATAATYAIGVALTAVVDGTITVALSGVRAQIRGINKTGGAVSPGAFVAQNGTALQFASPTTGQYASGIVYKGGAADAAIEVFIIPPFKV